MFDEAEVKKFFNQGKSNGNKINNKKAGRRISTRETGLKGLGKNKKAIADACKELYGVSSESNGIFHFGNNTLDEPNSAKCNISMEHVKEVGELIGVLWVDRFLMNDEFSFLWGNLSVVALDRKISDHCPIVLKDMELDFRPKPFRVFNIWTEEADCLHVVEEAWNKDEDKERECSNMMRQKARIKWDVEGDENSKFFHSYVKRRNNKCNLRGLMVNGVWCEDPVVIKAEIARHYKALFSKNGVIRSVCYCDRIEKFSMEEANWLEKIFSEAEVWDAIQGYGGDKAPGPDGFNFKFIRKF
ncbi:hypothetical protein Tco_0749887 [Tanacetum coccineum]|uniref:Uncharacterized protein n=1 Tax=Tanacetum coccineum TaxID=301880 RepID=A0ABQ4Z0R0_9ASTR